MDRQDRGSKREGDQGLNALALRADISNDEYGGLATLVEAVNDYCSSMLDLFRRGMPS
jgi:hypothetical protein